MDKEKLTDDKSELDNVKKYISVDFDDDDVMIFNFVEVAKIYIDKCVGEDYKKDEKLLRLSSLAMMMLVKFMYENRSPVITSTMKSNFVITTIFDTLSV